MNKFQASKLSKFPRKHEENFKKIREKLRTPGNKTGERMRKFYIRLGESL